MDKELFTKLYNNDSFKTFCNQIDQLRKQGYEISIPLETTTLLLGSGIGYIKDEMGIAAIHNSVKYFLNPSGREISKNTAFYDYFVITNIMWIADGKREQLEGNRWKRGSRKRSPLWR